VEREVNPLDDVLRLACHQRWLLRALRRTPCGSRAFPLSMASGTSLTVSSIRRAVSRPSAVRMPWRVPSASQCRRRMSLIFQWAFFELTTVAILALNGEILAGPSPSTGWVDSTPYSGVSW